MPCEILRKEKDINYGHYFYRRQRPSGQHIRKKSGADQDVSGKEGEAFEQQSLLPELFNMDSSSHWGEKLTTLTAMNGFVPVGENGNYPTDEMQ